MSSGDALPFIAPTRRLRKRRQKTLSKIQAANAWHRAGISGRAPYTLLLGLLSGCLLCTLLTIERVHVISQGEQSTNLHMGVRTSRRLEADTPSLHQYQGPGSFEPSGKDLSSNDTISSKAEEDEVDMLEVVHIVYTRFMQFQPNLLTLGKARLEVFRTFCLPSMVHQSSNNFLWIIHADPDLHSTIKQALIDLLSPYPHFLLVASNRYPSDFRKVDSAVHLLSEANVWSGDIDLARLGHDAAQTWPVLETRLDADDGLHNYFVQLVQNEAAHSLARCGESGTEISQWMVWCAYTTIEWHYNSPFPPSEPPSDKSFGYLLGVATHHCQTAGLTMGYCGPFSDVPNVPHHKMHQAVPSCSNKDQLNCLRRLKKLSPASIRARTATSAGMSNVIVHNGSGAGGGTYKLLADQENKQDSLWKGLAEFVHIRKEGATRTKAFLVGHLEDIAADNLKGQCTKGHSCKNSSQIILQNIAKEAKVTK